MATYYNLTSLEGLEVGDVVKYNKITTVETKGYKIKADLYGYGSVYSKTYISKGGYTSAVVDTSNIPTVTMMFSKGTTPYHSSVSLCYGSFEDYASCLYYRFLVAGANGYGASDYSYDIQYRGKGGGSTGGNGKRTDNSSDSASYGGKGGTQTSGGSGGKGYGYGKAGKSGTFGYGGAGGFSHPQYRSGGAGGDGWYGGGGGGESSSQSTYYNTGGGGSGFVIGISTTTYPDGYMGNNSSLISKLESAIIEGDTLVGEGATKYSTDTTIPEDDTSTNSIYTRVQITILELSSEPKGIFNSILNRYDKSGKFINTRAYVFNGDKWNPVDVNYFNSDNEFVRINGGTKT